MNTASTLSPTVFLTSSIGKKFTVALTGISLVGFLLEHAVSNLLLLNPDPAPYLAYAAFMGTNLIIRVLEIGLFLGFVLHIASALLVQFNNRQARPARYAVQRRSTKAWFSRAMLFSGSITFIFLVVHLGRFFVPHKVLHTSHLDLYADTRLAFSSPLYVAFYVVAMVLLGIHLAHGVQSALQTFGLQSSRSARAVRIAGYVYALFVPGMLALIPVWIYFVG
jgi:succinate dehydrogenase / fumarate reductase cytochrome b subunit